MPQLQRTLSLTSVIALVIGGVIGSGIFMKPAVMASQLGSPLLLLGVWVVAGIITLFGALTNAEAAAMFPETGGQYIFFQKMYGNGFAFLYGWSAFAVFNTAGNASIAYVCSTYADYFLHLPQLNSSTVASVQLHIPFIGTIYPLQNIGIKLLTVFLIVLFTWINTRSVQWGAGVQRFLTALKVTAILVLIFGIFFSGNGSSEHLFQKLSNAPQGFSVIPAFMAATAGAFWAYDGWNNITFIAGEIKHPQKVIPKSLLFGLSTCILIYALLNYAFILALPVDAMATSSFIGADAASAIWGSTGAALIVLLVVASTLGTTNSNVLATARVTFAMGSESKWFQAAQKVHPVFQTPAHALWINAGWTIVLIFSGSFDMLTDMLIFVSWLFYGMSALGVIILRFKMKHTERPYKVWGYPLVPVVFVLFTFFFLVSTVYTDIMNYRSGTTPIINSLFGLLIAAVGIPVYILSKPGK
ncbi:MAG TPA: amino acid permease [Lacibacter sp.]|nr:amino acid permease [Lacibacter sp.]